MGQYRVIIEFTLKDKNLKTYADARAAGIAIYEHVLETYNDDNSIKKTAFVSVTDSRRT